MNQFGVTSSWSEVTAVNLTSFPTMPLPPQTVPTTPPPPIPTYGIVLIAVGTVLGLVLVVGAILVVMCLTQLIKRHRLRRQVSPQALGNNTFSRSLAC